MNRPEPEVRVDHDAGALYVALWRATVAGTVPVSDGVLVDVDADDRVTGVEVLDGSDWRDALAALAREGRLGVIRRPVPLQGEALWRE